MNMTLTSPQFTLLLISLLFVMGLLKKRRRLRDSLAVILVLVAVAGAAGIITQA